MRKIDRGSGSAEIGHAGGQRIDLDGVTLRRGPLLYLVEGDVNVLQPFMRLLNEQFDEFILKFI